MSNKRQRMMSVFVSTSSTFYLKDKYENNDWDKYEKEGDDKYKDEENHLG